MNLFMYSIKRATSLLKISSIILLALVSQVALSQSPSNQLRGGEIQSMDEHRYGKVEIRMYTQKAIGTTSTFFWWRNGGHACGSQWNEIDIETIPRADRYQSNPIWQTSNNDCAQARREEGLHGNAGIYDRWVNYTLEWTPTSISWYHDGQLDRRITSNNGATDYHESVQHIDLHMRYAFNLWTQGNANPAWLGDIDFNALEDKPVYQFVDYFRYYEWNGSGFNSDATTNINFNSSSELTNNFHISNWEFSESQGFLSWSPSAVGVVDINGNGALWLGLFHAGDERPPSRSELPSGDSGNVGGGNAGGGSGARTTIQAESAQNSNNVRISDNVVDYIQNGGWASYPPVNIAKAGDHRITYRVASNQAGGGEIQFERAGGSEVYGNINVPNTGGWGDFRNISHTVNLPAGNINFGLYFLDGGFNIDYLVIEEL